MVGLTSKLARLSLGAALTLGLATAAEAAAAPGRIAPNSPALAAQWRAIADLPDWSGVWDPDRPQEARNLRENKPPWNAKAQKEIDWQRKETAEGRPPLVLYGCFPHGMPTWMMINHNVMEIIFSAGRVTMLGEVDGNRMRRIFTDGRSHPEDPDLTMHGHSIGHWEGDTLVIDTVGVAPQAVIAQSESIGISNNGDMHVVERIRLVAEDRLEVAMTITAPKVFTKPWSTVSYYKRYRGPRFDIVEGQCIRGDYDEGVDQFGNSIFVPSAVKRELGGVLPLEE